MGVLGATGHGVGLDGEGLVIGEEVDDAEVAGILGDGYEGKGCVNSCGENQGHNSQCERRIDGGVGHFGIWKERRVERMTEDEGISKDVYNRGGPRDGLILRRNLDEVERAVDEAACEVLSAQGTPQSLSKHVHKWIAYIENENEAYTLGLKDQLCRDALKYLG